MSIRKFSYHVCLSYDLRLWYRPYVTPQTIRAKTTFVWSSTTNHETIVGNGADLLTRGNRGGLVVRRDRYSAYHLLQPPSSHVCIMSHVSRRLRYVYVAGGGGQGYGLLTGTAPTRLRLRYPPHLGPDFSIWLSTPQAQYSDSSYITLDSLLSDISEPPPKTKRPMISKNSFIAQATFATLSHSPLASRRHF